MEKQNDLLDEFDSQFREFKNNLNVAIDIHKSIGWREDRHLMRDSISPTLRTLTEELKSLVTKQQQRIKLSNQELSDQINNAEETILFSIFVVLVITLFVIALSLRNERLNRDVLERRRNEELMRHKAHHDALTGLPNRAFFNDHLYDLFLNTKDEMFALLFIDLDGFKAVNDNAGHDAGDFILVETAKRIKEVVRKSDLVVRLGGDEFTVVLDFISDKSVAEKIAKAICDKVSEEFIFDEKVLNVSTSIGVTYSNHIELNYHENIQFNVETMTKQADSAMYQAKKAGKNTYRNFE